MHNYFYHPSSPAVEDNKIWNAADPTSACRVDGLYGNYGVTWAKHFHGYSEDELLTLPRVTTETGATIGGAITEEIQRAQPAEHVSEPVQARVESYVGLPAPRPYGRKRQPDIRLFQARLHAAQSGCLSAQPDHHPGRQRFARQVPGQLSYSLPEQPATVHDLLLQKSDGTFQLVVWGERVAGFETRWCSVWGRSPA